MHFSKFHWKQYKLRMCNSGQVKIHILINNSKSSRNFSQLTCIGMHHTIWYCVVERGCTKQREEPTNKGFLLLGHIINVLCRCCRTISTYVQMYHQSSISQDTVDVLTRNECCPQMSQNNILIWSWNLSQCNLYGWTTYLITHTPLLLPQKSTRNFKVNISVELCLLKSWFLPPATSPCHTVSSLTPLPQLS